jgi:hypothetical protein
MEHSCPSYRGEMHDLFPRLPVLLGINTTDAGSLQRATIDQRLSPRAKRYVPHTLLAGVHRSPYLYLRNPSWRHMIR